MAKVGRPPSTDITTNSPLIRTIFERAHALGMNDTQLAKRAGYHYGTIFYLRTGARQHIKGRKMGGNLVTIQNLAEAVGLELVLVPQSGDAEEETRL